MTTRMINWLQTFSGKREIDVEFFYNRDRRRDDCFASCHINHDSYTINMDAYEEYKDDEATMLYLTAHEVGHNLDTRFNKYGITNTHLMLIILGIWSVFVFVLSLLFKNMIFNWATMPWIAVAYICFVELFIMDSTSEEDEQVAENFVLKYLGHGILLHGNLNLALIRGKWIHKNNPDTFKDWTAFPCTSYLTSIVESVRMFDGFDEEGKEWDRQWK